MPSKNPEIRKLTNRKALLKYRYGITPEELDELKASQDYRCAVCGKGSSKLNVDHDHTTNKVRGLLCWDCNVAIGKLGDNLEGVLNALYYLLKAEGSK